MEGTADDKAFGLLAAQIQSKILGQAATGVVLKMTEVCSIYNKLLHSQIPWGKSEASSAEVLWRVTAVF